MLVGFVECTREVFCWFGVAREVLDPPLLNWLIWEMRVSMWLYLGVICFCAPREDFLDVCFDSLASSRAFAAGSPRRLVLAAPSAKLLW